MSVFIRQRPENNNPNMKYLFSRGDQDGNDHLFPAFLEHADVQPVGIHDADAAFRSLLRVKTICRPEGDQEGYSLSASSNVS